MPDEFDTGAFVRTPAWHQMGVVLAEPVPPYEMQSHADLEWQVEMHPIVTLVPYKDEVLEVPIEDQFATVRMDLEQPLGVVGTKYEPIQNDVVFEFLDALFTEGDDIQMETAGSLKGGRWVWAQAKVGDDYEIAGDAHSQYLTVATSHDGSLSFSVFPTNVRVVCANTFSAAYATKTRSYKVKHTRNHEIMVAAAMEALQISYSETDQFRRDVERLMNQSYTDTVFREMVDKLFPVDEDKDSQRTITSRNAVKGQIISLWNSSPTIGQYKGTAWGAVNAVNEWEQWGDPLRKSKISKAERTITRFLNGNATTYTERALALVGADKPTK